MGRRRYHQFAGRTDLDVHLLAPAHWYEFGRAMTADPPDDPGVTLHVEPVRLGHFPLASWYLHYYPGLARLIRHLDPDVIHLWEEPWSVVALQATRLRGRAGLVVETDQNILKRLPPPFQGMRSHVLRRTTFLLSRSPQATAVARACGYQGPVLPIGYGVDQEIFYALPGSSRQGAGHRAIRLSYVGRLVEEKGLDDVLEAMGVASSPVRLAIMGEGPYEPSIRRRIAELGLADRVSLRGWGSPTDVADAFRAADISILLTRTTAHVREQFGRAIIESQSCGVPVIGSSCGAIPDIIAGGGWVVPERAPRAMARLLDEIAGAPQEIVRRAQAGLDNVSARFTFAIVARTLAESWMRSARTASPAHGAAATSATAQLPTVL